MEDIGYWTDGQSKYSFYLNGNTILMIPAPGGEVFFPYREKEQYFLNLTGNRGIRGAISHYSAFIVSTEWMHSGGYKLKAKYVLSSWEELPISGFDVFGDAIDDLFFFAPDRLHVKEGDLLPAYPGFQIIDTWDIQYQTYRMKVQLLFMDVLSFDGRSHMEYHPVFRVLIEDGGNAEQLIKIYEAILNAVRIIRHRYSCGNLSIKLINEHEGTAYRVGYISDYCNIDKENFENRYVILPYEKWQPFMKRMLELAINSENLNIKYFPSYTSALATEEYTPEIISLIFTAFEQECGYNKEVYETPDVTLIADIKNQVLADLEEKRNAAITQAEKDFIVSASNDIKRLGTSYGQRRKITNAAAFIKPVLMDYLSGFTDEDINDEIEEKIWEAAIKALKDLPNIRGRNLHHGAISILSEEEAKTHEMFEVLVYSQMLTRAGFTEAEISDIIKMAYERVPGNYTFIRPD